MPKILILTLSLLWTIVCGARFLPESKKESIVSLIASGADATAAQARLFIKNTLESILFLGMAASIAVLFVGIPIQMIREASLMLKEAPHIVAGVPLAVVVLGIPALALSVNVLGPISRMVLSDSPGALLSAGPHGLRFEEILSPLASYIPGGFDDSLVVLKDAFFAASITLDIFLKVTLVASLRLVAAVLSVAGVLLIGVVEVVLFPAFLAARLVRKRSATEFFIFVGWVASVLAISATLFLELVSKHGR